MVRRAEGGGKCPGVDNLLAALLALALGEQDGVDVGEDTAGGDRHAAEELVELLVVADGELNTCRYCFPLPVLDRSQAPSTLLLNERACRSRFSCRACLRTCMGRSGRLKHSHSGAVFTRCHRSIWNFGHHESAVNRRFGWVASPV